MHIMALLRLCVHYAKKGIEMVVATKEEMWNVLSGYTKDIKKFASEGDFDSALILCDDLKRAVKYFKRNGVEK